MKVNKQNMAPKEERKNLSDRINLIKDKLKIPYKDLNSKINHPCGTSTLQIRAKYPNKECTNSLLQKINDSLDAFQNTSIQDVMLEKRVSDLTLKELFDAIEAFFIKKN